MKRTNGMDHIKYLEYLWLEISRISSHAVTIQQQLEKSCCNPNTNWVLMEAMYFRSLSDQIRMKLM